MHEEQHEIEKKFYWDESRKQELHRNQQIKSKEFSDIYFDNVKHELTKRDWWLRRRGTAWQLKIPSSPQVAAQAYREIETPEEIADYLGLPEITIQALQNANIHPFITLHNKRESYKDQGLTISLDVVNNNFRYLRIGEIEKIVQTPQESQQAVEDITRYAQQQGIDLLQPEPKKVAVFLKAGHYEELVQANVIDPEAYKTNPLTEE